MVESAGDRFSGVGDLGRISPTSVTEKSYGGVSELDGKVADLAGPLLGGIAQPTSGGVLAGERCTIVSQKERVGAAAQLGEGLLGVKGEEPPSGRPSGGVDPGLMQQEAQLQAHHQSSMMKLPISDNVNKALVRLDGQEALRCIKEEKTDPNQANSLSGYTAMHCLARKGTPQEIKELVRLGGDVNIQDKKGDTPILRAMRKGNVDNMKTLIEAGAEVNIKTGRGETLLTYAIQQGNAEVVKALLDGGADPTAANNSGQTPLQVAQEVGNKSMTRHLLNALPKPERHAEIFVHFQASDDPQARMNYAFAIINSDEATVEELVAVHDGLKADAAVERMEDSYAPFLENIETILKQRIEQAPDDSTAAVQKQESAIYHMSLSLPSGEEKSAFVSSMRKALHAGTGLSKVASEGGYAVDKQTSGELLVSTGVVLGTGGYKKVQRAFTYSVGEGSWHAVALSTSLETRDAEAVAKEVKAVAEVNAKGSHPNILSPGDYRHCTYTDPNTGEVKEGAMSPIAQGNLSSVVVRGAESKGERLAYTRQCVGAVHHLHKNGFLHNDLHEGNFFCFGKTVKLGDFDIKTKFSTEPQQVSGGAVPCFAPERARNNNMVTDKSDVFSLGLILSRQLMLEWQAGVFTTLLQSAGSQEEFDQVVQEYLPDPNDPEQQLVRQMLRWDPGQRPTMDEVNQVVNGW